MSTKKKTRFADPLIPFSSKTWCDGAFLLPDSESTSKNISKMTRTILETKSCRTVLLEVIVRKKMMIGPETRRTWRTRAGFFVPRASLTLELVTVGDLALPVAGLFVQIKRQSTGTRDLLQAGPCTPKGGKGRNLSLKIMIGFLLSSVSQFLTLVFQSQVCLSISKARPVGHFTVASLVTPISVALSHLKRISSYLYYHFSVEISPFLRNHFVRW